MGVYMDNTDVIIEDDDGEYEVLINEKNYKRRVLS